MSNRQSSTQWASKVLESSQIAQMNVDQSAFRHTIKSLSTTQKMSALTILHVHYLRAHFDKKN